MKENSPLLIALAVMLLIVAAILLPDYFACRPFILFTTADEARAEALEAADLHRYVRGPVRQIAIKNHSLTMFVDYSYPTAVSNARGEIGDAWMRSYAVRHHDAVDDIPCLLLTITDVNSHESETCESHDSVMRLIENDCEFL